MYQNLQLEIITKANELKELFVKYHQSYVTAESLTAGFIAASIVEVPGASAYFEGGFVTYSNELKEDVLNVSKDTIKEHGAVSKETAVQMTEGALNRARLATIAVAVSGIAGPDGGTPTKPVGTVWMSVQKRGDRAVPLCLHLKGDREEIRLKTTLCALKGIIAMTKGESLDFDTKF